MSIMPAFTNFPEEARLIGNMLAGYSNLELGMCHCVAMGANNLDVVVKAVFRVKGESSRIDVADAIGRSTYREGTLAQDFERAIASIRFCLKIRNQYAHCLWHNDWSGHLAFSKLDEVVEKHEELKDLSGVNSKHVNTHILKKQEAYFVYTDQLFMWVNYEGRRLSGSLSTRICTRPPETLRPKMHIP